MKTLKVDQVYDGYDYDPETETHSPMHKYKVTKVTNSVTPKIMDHLTMEELARYCEAEDWEVTIT